MKAKKLPPETMLEAELKRLPDLPRANKRTWTRLQDEMILKYVPIKGTPAVAAILQIPIVTIRARFHKLQDGGK